jgi:hypothetical protein
MKKSQLAGTRLNSPTVVDCIVGSLHCVYIRISCWLKAISISTEVFSRCLFFLLTWEGGRKGPYPDEKWPLFDIKGRVCACKPEADQSMNKIWKWE